MTVRIGVICDARAYRDQPGSDVIRFYQALTRDHAFESFHLPLPALRAVLASGDLSTLPALGLSDCVTPTLWCEDSTNGVQPMPTKQFELLF